MYCLGYFKTAPVHMASCGCHNRPHYGSCPSVCPSVLFGLHNAKTKRRRETKISVNVPHGSSNRCAIFTAKGQRSTGWPHNSFNVADERTPHGRMSVHCARAMSGTSLGHLLYYWPALILMSSVRQLVNTRAGNKIALQPTAAHTALL